MIKVISTPLGKEKLFFITDGEFHQWADVAQSSMRQLDVKAKTIIIPEVIMFPAACVAELFASFGTQPALLNRQKVKEICKKSWTASSAKFFKSYSFNSKYNLSKGLKETIDWYKNNLWL